MKNVGTNIACSHENIQFFVTIYPDQNERKHGYQYCRLTLIHAVLVTVHSPD
jgi:hypothetical protein